VGGYDLTKKVRFNYSGRERAIIQVGFNYSGREREIIQRERERERERK